jgi:hypothetical protein
MLTPEQHDEFRRFGILRIPGAVPSRVAEKMCDSVWEMLDRRYRIRRGDPETWKGQRIAGTKDRPKSMTFEQVANPALRAILDDLLGSAAWERDEHWGSLLVSFPGAPPEARDSGWDVPYQGWHVDAPLVRSLPNLYGVRLFTCLAKLPPGGGATLAVAGSPRVAAKSAGTGGVERLRSADLRTLLIKRHSWFRELCSPDGKVDRIREFMNTTSQVEDVEVRVVELTGEPGDIYLMHPVMLHAGSPNCLATPRMVLSTTVYQHGVNWNALYAPEAAQANP